MFEIYLEDIHNFKIASVKLCGDGLPNHMVLVAEIILTHTHVPAVQIIAYGGLLVRGGYSFSVHPKNKQDIITIQAVSRIEQILGEFMDEWVEIGIDHSIGNMYAY